MVTRQRLLLKNYKKSRHIVAATNDNFIHPFPTFQPFLWQSKVVSPQMSNSSLISVSIYIILVLFGICVAILLFFLHLHFSTPKI